MENAAFNEGYKAHAKGIAYEDNPYNENPFMIFRAEWFRGWEASYDEEQLFKL